MSQRRLLEQRLTGQGEIGEILSSMKNLAYMETRKLTRLLENQRRVVDQIERIARDFLTFHSEMLPLVATTNRVYLVIGSRRGLCGDFNAKLLAALRSELAQQEAKKGCLIIAVGHKLCQRLADAAIDAVALEGGRCG